MRSKPAFVSTIRIVDGAHRGCLPESRARSQRRTAFTTSAHAQKTISWGRRKDSLNATFALRRSRIGEIFFRAPKGPCTRHSARANLFHELSRTIRPQQRKLPRAFAM